MPRPLRPRRVLGAVAYCNAVVAALTFGLAASGPLLRDALAVNATGLGVLLAAPGLGLVLGTLAWGELADRLDERRLLTLAFVGFAAATAAAAMALGQAAVAACGVALVAAGACGSAAHSAGGRAIAAVYPPHRHGTVLAIRHTAIPVGGALGAAALPAAERAWGFVPPMLALALLGLVAAAGVSASLPRGLGLRASIRAVRDRRRAGTAALADDGGERGRSPLRDLQLWMLFIGGSSMAFVQLGGGAFATVLLTTRAGLGIGAAATIFSVLQLLAAGSRIALGVWSDRVRSRVVLLLRIALVAAAAVVPMLLGVPGAVDGALLMAALLVVTSCNGVAVAAAASLAPAGRTGATLGMQTTGNALAGTIAPVLLGVLLDAAGWLAFEACLLAVLLVGCTSLALLARRQGDRSMLEARTDRVPRQPWSSRRR